eukprot:8187289-Pyramimonas_sp.AAC.1
MEEGRVMMLQPTLTLITRKNFERPQKVPKLEGFHVPGPGRHSPDTLSTLFRHPFDTFLGARNSFCDAVLK